ncbi:MAG: hypothetical protein AABW71_00150 [Nanoarchaeota archaeon]
MYKKGLSHIEFVVSFTIFIGFLVFAFVFFNPLQSQRTLKSTMDYAWIEVSREGRENIESYSVSIDTGYASAVNFEIAGIPLDYNATAEDENGNPIDVHRDSNGIVYLDRGTSNFIKILYSPALENSPFVSLGASLGTITPTTTTGNFYISSSEIKDIYFERLFLELNQSYYSDYAALKEDLNLPNRIDFGFIITFDNHQIRAMNDVPEGIEVLSKNDRVEIIKQNGDHGFAEVTVLVW